MNSIDPSDPPTFDNRHLFANSGSVVLGVAPHEHVHSAHTRSTISTNTLFSCLLY
ncbi:hypothetical protein CCHR01_05231 [Colletotrichum chrysophilum]|uniref:Uncharacterized protein n=1 Tax=Colletotrichum chrysophilum TaxID=1836956 RepID=A0AAD9AR17_9PEZI|nr:hypothetical protein CCHR01_05231 [Colletotrichum chrysophilum]